MENLALLIAVLFTGSVTTVLLVADAVTGTLAARSVRDEDDQEFLTRTRVRDLVWSIAITAVVAVLVAFSVDAVVRSGPYVHGSYRAVLGLLLACWSGTFVVGAIGALAAIRRERPSYSRIRRDLRDRAVLTMQPDEHRAYLARLERADRARGRRLRASDLLRVLGLLIVLASATTGVVADAGREPLGVVLAVVGAAIGIAAFVIALRAAAVRADALEQLLRAQRAEVVTLLERARIPRAGGTPGLARRVSKALAILKEQQK